MMSLNLGYSCNGNASCDHIAANSSAERMDSIVVVKPSPFPSAGVNIPDTLAAFKCFVWSNRGEKDMFISVLRSA